MREKLIEEKVPKSLSKYSPAGRTAQQAVKGALWVLKEKQLETTHTSSASHIMISYSWAQKERMRELAFNLKQKGYPIWIDVEQMEGSVLEKISEAIEESIVVIVGFSSQYKESQACRTEAEYAYNLKKEVIFVRAEDDFNPRGWLGAMLGNKLWYDPWNPSKDFDLVLADILRRLEKVSKPQEGSVARDGGVLRVAVEQGNKEVAVVSKREQTKDYSAVTVPESSSPLPAEMLTLAEMEKWQAEEVCRWLRMNQLDELLRPFVYHNLTGKNLLEWSKLGEEGFLRIWEQMKIDRVGLLLQFRNVLRETVQQQVEQWEPPQVSAWLRKEGMEKLAGLAEKEGWDGRVLMGLNQARKEAGAGAFLALCKEFQVPPLDQARFVSVLVRLPAN